MCFPFSPGKGETHKQFDPHPFPGQSREFVYVYFIWIQKGFTAEPLRNDSGANFQRNDSDSGPKVRDTGRKSELQTKSRRYSPESEPNRPEKGPEWVLGASAENPP